MKNFVEPEIRIMKLDIDDIITTSDNLFPIIPVGEYKENELTIVSLD